MVPGLALNQRVRSSILRRPIFRSSIVALFLAALAACRAGDESRDAPAAPAAAGERFATVEDGVVLDERTGLQWTSRDHERALPWDEADRHCGELALGGWKDWRLPEVEELRALYDERFAESCGERSCHLDPAIRLRDPYVWTATARGPGTRFYVDFVFGNSLSPGIGPKLVRRVLCVRRAP